MIRMFMWPLRCMEGSSSELTLNRYVYEGSALRPSGTSLWYKRFFEHLKPTRKRPNAATPRRRGVVQLSVSRVQWLCHQPVNAGMPLPQLQAHRWLNAGAAAPATSHWSTQPLMSTQHICISHHSYAPWATWAGRTAFPHTFIRCNHQIRLTQKVWRLSFADCFRGRRRSSSLSDRNTDRQILNDSLTFANLHCCFWFADYYFQSKVWSVGVDFACLLLVTCYLIQKNAFLCRLKK